jgi:Maltokinase N-terminal cap domain
MFCRELVKLCLVSIIYRTTLTPSKMELIAAWLPSRSWYRLTGRAPELVKAGGFRLEDPEGEVGIEFMVVTNESGDQPTTYHVPLTYRGAPLGGADDVLIGTMEHGVLGQRWAYDGTRDPVLVTQLLALIQGVAEPQAQSESHTLDPTVRARPAVAVPVQATAFTAIDGLEETEILLAVATEGQLAIRVPRILRPLPLVAGRGDEAAQAFGGHGYVTAPPWRLAGDEASRAVFATAEPR